jgi:hypothetical protein
MPLQPVELQLPKSEPISAVQMILQILIVLEEERTLMKVWQWTQVLS